MNSARLDGHLCAALVSVPTKKDRHGDLANTLDGDHRAELPQDGIEAQMIMQSRYFMLLLKELIVHFCES